MGQYHCIVNVTKEEYISSYPLGDGAKWYEQAASQYGMMAAVWGAIACPEPRGGGDPPEHPWTGRWHGDRIVLVGDYAEPDDISDLDARALYARETFTDVSDIAQDFLKLAFDIDFEGNGWLTRVVDGKPERPAMAPDIVIRRER